MNPNLRDFYRCALLACAAALPARAALAQGRHLSTQDYARAAQFMPYATAPLVDDDVEHVHWLAGDRFWFIAHDASGDHYRIMDAATGKAAAPFNRIKLAAALSNALGKPVDAAKLGITAIKIVHGRLQVTRAGKRFICALTGAGHCRAAAPSANVSGILSPNGKYLAFIRHWNLWVRNMHSGKERQLTFDGVKNFGYATDNAGWLRSKRPVLNWSPDSRQIATYQQDQRKVGNMYLVSAAIGHPTLQKWKYPLPGDTHVFMIDPVIIDVASGHVIRLQMPPEQRLSSLCDDISCQNNGHWDDVQWAPDSKTLALVSTSRNRHHEWFRVANARTGAVRTVFEYSTAKYYQSGIGAVDWRYLPASDQVLWYSSRTGWGNLDLYSLKSGQFERPVTAGRGDVTQVLHVARRTGTVWFRAVGRIAGINPYYEQFWKVNLSGGAPKRLTPRDCDNLISMSPDGKYFVDSCSTPQHAPVTTLRSAASGRVIATVARANLKRLRAIGWQAPQQIVVTARDGHTKLYGLLFKPTNFDPHKKYPIIDYVYPGPQIGSVFTFRFEPSDYDNQALAELGFIVIAVDGMGTPYRSRHFQRYWYGNMGDNTLPDQIAAIRELAQRDPWIDLSRVGIWGHSGGGNATTDAMFRYPDFFKVGWAESGNQDNRDYENDWGELYQGLLKRNANGTTNYDNQANELLAAHLRGHLMLTYGTLDDNVPPENTQIVVEALIKANRPFDMIAIPNVRHGYGYATPYITRRRWDYFVRYLAGNTPPRHFALKPWPWR
ncbi:MAG: DPP IV N-terminal domain-containing protein [Steroidobacteraceae bacterium]